MCFGTKHSIAKAGNINIAIQNETIKQVTTFKYLGVVLDETLSFNNHTSKTIKSASHKLSLLRTVRPLPIVQ